MWHQTPNNCPCLNARFNMRYKRLRNFTILTLTKSFSYRPFLQAFYGCTSAAFSTFSSAALLLLDRTLSDLFATGVSWKSLSSPFCPFRSGDAMTRISQVTLWGGIPPAVSRRCLLTPSYPAGIFQVDFTPPTRPSSGDTWEVACYRYNLGQMFSSVLRWEARPLVALRLCEELLLGSFLWIS